MCFLVHFGAISNPTAPLRSFLINCGRRIFGWTTSGIPAEFTIEREGALKIVGEGAVLGYDPERPLSSETRHRVRQKRAYWLGDEQCQNEKGPRSGVPSWGFPKNTLIWANSQISQKPALPQILSKPKYHAYMARQLVFSVVCCRPLWGTPRSLGPVFRFSASCVAESNRFPE